MLFSGIFSLPLCGTVVVALTLTHVTIAAVTIYLHRAQSHHALVLHVLPSHFFRFWLWLTTGMITREWIAVHRKHHAKSETVEDPHSPQIVGIRRVLWGGMFLYRKEAKDAQTIARYGGGAPSDWMERHVYTAFPGGRSCLDGGARDIAVRPTPRLAGVWDPNGVDSIFRGRSN